MKAPKGKGMQIVVKEFKRRGRFDMYFDGRYLGRSTTPLLTAARILLAEGLPPETPIEMRHQCSTTISLRSTIGAAAKLEVNNERFAPYRPKKGGVEGTEDEENEVEATPLADATNKRTGEAVQTRRTPETPDGSTVSAADNPSDGGVVSQGADPRKLGMRRLRHQHLSWLSDPDRDGARLQSRRTEEGQEPVQHHV